MTRSSFVRSSAGCLLLLIFASGAALAQYGDPGPLPRPRPYGDHGTMGPIGNPPIVYPNPNAPRPNPLAYWRGRIISGPYWGGGTVIIINNGLPCYAPIYYGYGFGGSFNDSALTIGMQWGPVAFGYQQQYGAGYWPVPTQSYGFGQWQQGMQPWQSSNRVTARQPDRSSGTDRANRSAGADDSDSYYLNRKPKLETPLDRDPSLRQAVDDIQAAFRTGDISRLERHVNPTETLTLQAKGRTRKPLAGAAYLDMTRDALKTMKTVKYDLSSVEPGSNGAWMVYGTHTLKAEDGTEKTFSVGFVLKKRGDTWLITEVSADPAK